MRYNKSLHIHLSNNIGLSNIKKRTKSRCKTVTTIGLFLLINLIIINNENAFALPPHCDRTGYPSCYSIGYDAGKESPGTSCPSGHSANFCEGWNAGASTVSNNGIQNVENTAPPPSNATSGQSATLFFVILFLFFLIVGVIVLKLRNRKKPKERKGFSESVKENIMRKQNHKCAHCNKLLNVVDWNHKNGDRSDNRESNCQALCPNCHAIKTRRTQSKR